MTLSMTKYRFPRRVLISMLAMVALFALPSVAEAAPKGDHDYMTRGIVVAKTADSFTVCVGTERSSSNEHARQWQGSAVTFAYASTSTIDLGSLVKVESRQSATQSKFTALSVDVNPGTAAKHFRGGSCAVTQPDPPPYEGPIWDS